jgi:hypothetical protein
LQRLTEIATGLHLEVVNFDLSCWFWFQKPPDPRILVLWLRGKREIILWPPAWSRRSFAKYTSKAQICYSDYDPLKLCQEPQIYSNDYWSFAESNHRA